MGGTGWSYVAPYQADIEKALQELKLDVFERGDYERPLDSIDNLTDLDHLGFFSVDEQRRQEIITEFSAHPLNVLIERVGVAGLRSELRSLTDTPKLTNWDDLKALQCLSANGTHSILDMDCVSEEPGFGAFIPMSPEQLLQVFGTENPDQRMIEDAERWGKLETGPRWQGVYLVAYDSGNPTTIYFIGSSGD